MKHFYLSIYIVTSLLIFSCSNSNKQEQTVVESSQTEKTHLALTDRQATALHLVLGKIEKRVVSNTIKVNGVLDVPPQNLVTISAPLGGFVKQTDLLQGMKVKKGQVIAILEHPDYIQLQQDYLDAKNQREFLELEYKRQQDLAADNVNAAKTLQQAKANYMSTKAKAEGLSARLKMININPESLEDGEIKQSISIVAPLSGYVTQVNVNLGM